VAWQSSERSGIALANRWLDAEGKLVRAVDGRTGLPRTVEPGEAIELRLTVTAPERRGRWALELDLVDEGVAWFQQRGSEPLRFEVDVRRRSAVRAGYRAIRRWMA